MEPSEIGSSVSRDAKFDAKVPCRPARRRHLPAVVIFQYSRLSDFYSSLPGLGDTAIWLEGDRGFVEGALHDY